VAEAFAKLGYDVALLGDSDQSLVPDPTSLENLGVRVVLWADGMALEQRIVQDLPWEGVAGLVRLAMDLWDKGSVRDSIKGKLSASQTDLVGDPQVWKDEGYDEAELRRAIAEAVMKHKVNNRKGWFKRVDLAEKLAGVVIDNWESIVHKDLGQKTAQLKTWAHGNG